MKLLIDANLSWRLVKKLDHLFTECRHVTRTGLPVPASDVAIWEWAKQNNYILILTRDDDFRQITEWRGFPPKIVMLRIENRKSDYVAALIEQHYEDIQALVETEEYGLLEIYG